MGPFPAVQRPELLQLPDRLEGQRVLLRAFREDDGPAMFAAVEGHREDLRQWLGWIDDHRNVEDSISYVRRMVAAYSLRDMLIMGIWERATGAFVGGTGFHAPDWSVPKASLGYYLIPPARRRGYATEAVKLLVDFGFRHARFNRIDGSCDPDNDDSAAVFRRAGFRQEARMRNDMRDHNGRLRDSLLFALSVDEFPQWRAQRAHELPPLDA